MEGKKTFFTYIARCCDSSLYVGITQNLTNREKKHNAGEGSTYTKHRLPIHIVYAEDYTTRSLAARREKQLKGWTRQKKESLIKYGHPFPHKNI